MNDIVQSTLYVVATPIGNLEDISLRALNILKSVDVIACEDTRHSIKLLNHYDIKKKLISYHSYNERASSNGIIMLLKSGKSVALISDGGTPVISDPGYLLVKECRENGINIISIPGASAFLTLLAGSGFRTDKFFFVGFLSPKEGKRKRELLKLKDIEGTIILYESPHRIIKLLDNIFEIFEKKSIILGKELTKINETIFSGSANEIKNIIEKENKILGEFTLLIANY